MPDDTRALTEAEEEEDALGLLCRVILEHDAGGLTMATARDVREFIARATEEGT